MFKIFKSILAKNGNEDSIKEKGIPKSSTHPVENKIVLKLVKKVELSIEGTKTYYFIEKNDGFISNSFISESESNYNAKQKISDFFDRIVKLKGETETEEIIKEVIL